MQSPPHWSGSPDPRLAFIIDRQSQIIDGQNRNAENIREIRIGMYQMHESMHQIDKKLDRLPRGGERRRETGITIGGAWFKDIQSLLLWLAIAAMAMGHVNADVLSEMVRLK